MLTVLQLLLKNKKIKSNIQNCTNQNRHELLKKIIDSRNPFKHKVALVEILLHLHPDGLVAERLGTGLQNRLLRFESGRDLLKALRFAGLFFI